MDMEEYNPNCVPLECLTLKKTIDGVQKNIPALDEKWSESRYFTIYKPPPNPKKDASFPIGAKEDWLERLDFLLSDFQWLLSLEQYRFWSQLIFKEDSLNGVLSFLQEGFPFYALDEFPNDNEIKEIYNKAQTKVFQLLQRMITHSESKWEHVTKKKLGEILYDNYLITLPMIFDICLLYGYKNLSEVSKFLQTLLCIQPAYLDDIKKSVPFIHKVFSMIEERFDCPSSNNGEPIKLNKVDKPKSEKMSLRSTKDLILYLLDSVATLDTFFEVYPSACRFYHSEGLAVRLAAFYENLIPKINEQVDTYSSEVTPLEVIMKLKHKLDIIRFEILKVYRHCLSFCITSAVKFKSNSRSHCEEFYNILTESLNGKLFIRDYHSLYPVDVDFDVLSSVCPEIDSEKRNYIMQCVLEAISRSPSQKSSSLNFDACSSANEPSTSNTEPSTSHNGEVAIQNNKLSDVELASLITEVKDILPHLGDGFIKVCLEHYNYQSSQVINAVLENLLPEYILEIDQDLPIIPDEETPAEIPYERINVFDNDEFDVLANDKIDLSRVHKGKKKSKYRNLNEMLNDKSHIQQFKDAYNKFGVIDTESSVYDDEYDDTYDDAMYAPPSEDTTEERRPFVTPRVLQQYDKSKKESSEEDEESEVEESTNGTKPLDFCVNPEILRARAEQRYQSRRHNQPARNVVGKPKGQGQEKDVLKNRDYKAEHKGSRANHNRRIMASKKRNMGMIPS